MDGFANRGAPSSNCNSNSQLLPLTLPLIDHGDRCDLA